MSYQFFGELPGFGPGACTDPNAATQGGQFGGCFCKPGFICSQTEDPTWGCTGQCLSMVDACTQAGGVWNPTAQACEVIGKPSQPSQQAPVATPEECSAAGFDFDPSTGQCVLREIAQIIDNCQQAGNVWDATTGTCIASGHVVGGQVGPFPGGSGQSVPPAFQGQSPSGVSHAGITEGQKTAALVVGGLGILLLVASWKS